MTPAARSSAARDLLAAFDGNRQIAPLTDHSPLTLEDGYALASEVTALRKSRGETPVGRKIGFTNRTIWSIYNVNAPIWGWVWDTTLHDIPSNGTISLPERPELRIEPEIVLGLASAPKPDMTPEQLWSCVEWVAHGMEIVTSIYPDWRFTAPDTAAAMGMHAGLWVGPRLPAATVDPDSLPGIELTLTGPGTSLSGKGTDVLGSPLLALHQLVKEIADTPGTSPIRAGEVITTGTLTDAPRIARNQVWQTDLKGTALPGFHIRLT